MKTVIQEKMLNNIEHFISLTKYPDKYLSYFLFWRTGQRLTCRADLSPGHGLGACWTSSLPVSM